MYIYKYIRIYINIYTLHDGYSFIVNHGTIGHFIKHLCYDKRGGGGTYKCTHISISSKPIIYCTVHIYNNIFIF